jgi:UDP-N-acetylmuramoylalanine--D-glutamate ligase
MTTQELTHKNILILGLGREGLSTYEFLRRQLPDQQLYLADEKKLSELSEQWQKIISHDSNSQFIQLAKETLDYHLPSLDLLIIKTAGIPKNKITIFNLPAEAKITSNTQLFFDWAMTEDQLTVIGVTGTKGKSTTTSVIHHVLKTNGLNAYIGGNIGKPPLNLIEEIQGLDKHTFAVLELSSHQLAELETSPCIAVIQEIAEEHLDYYGSIQAYAQAKANITLHQTAEDLLIYNHDNLLACQIAEQSTAQKKPISLDLIPHIVEPVIALNEVPLAGKFNLYNIMPAIIIGQKFGLSNQQIKQALQSFKSLPHRLEFVTEINGVKYYNDSLATNPHATIRALEAFSEQPVILIAGGFDRGLDYAPLAEKILASQVKHLILLPTTGEKIRGEIEIRNTNYDRDRISYLLSRTNRVTSMPEAVKLAYSHAKAGDIVLMSPASASFNLFKDYADRGEQFKKEVLKLN